MIGLSYEIEKVFEPLSKLDCILDYTLIGGTALAIQTGHRLSEDLDFCKWLNQGKPEVDWPQILHELSLIFKSVKPDILDFNQVNFVADKVKLSFYSNKLYKSPITEPIKYLNNIYIPDLETIGAMKLEVMLRRSSFRDYYDIYSILQEGIALTPMIRKAVSYSNHIIKTKDILSFISNGGNFRRDKHFDLLMPKYSVTEKDIEEFVRSIIKKEFPV